MGITTGRAAKALLIVAALAVAGCAAQFRNHGYIPEETDLQALIVGVDTRDTVEATVGKPTTGGVLGDESWYYVRSRVRDFAWRAPETIERQVLAISFSEDGTVRNIERFGLEEGRVVALSRRVTETSIRDAGLLAQLLRNFGRINVGDALAGGDG
ncbi:outer membrane protein assembly factor BamE [Jannaschia sp. Os4]|uniref:outer membrane protein assembly factor BamE n=1 Tax=Jannaschia sp. Os4 TaxID=2807617 RepID=UPI00193962AC|nr:outer membrane protein assembly factor BamE [Jannaschia sp. Os4]MBM2577704.1 outer membrane protein assembly factor BamE [Jannaschia sp. Os4]